MIIFQCWTNTYCYLHNSCYCISTRTGWFCPSGIMILATVECELWGWRCESNMEVKKDGGGSWSSSGASSAPSCYRSTLVAFFLFFLVIGVFVGLVIGESRDAIELLYTCCKIVKHICKGRPFLMCGCAAYLVQEQHYFMETVELKGLKYDPVLQDENSGFFIVLSSVLKSKVSPGSDYVSSNFSCTNY